MDRIKERITIFGICAIVLLAGFIVFRFVLFDMHGMKQWPIDLLAAGLVLSLVGALIKGYFTCCFTVVGYIFGFAAMVNFALSGVDAGGGASNNGWIIWLAVFVIGAVLGIVIDIAMKLRTKKAR